MTASSKDIAKDITTPPHKTVERLFLLTVASTDKASPVTRAAWPTNQDT